MMIGSSYKEVLAKFTWSGFHESEFFGYYNGTMKASMFQYEKVMSLIEKNGESFTKATDPEYMDLLQQDFHNLKKRKRELDSKLGFC